MTWDIDEKEVFNELVRFIMKYIRLELDSRFPDYDTGDKLSLELNIFTCAMMATVLGAVSIGADLDELLQSVYQTIMTNSKRFKEMGD